jgi:hypothetical protein
MMTGASLAPDASRCYIRRSGQEKEKSTGTIPQNQEADCITLTDFE